MAVKYDVYKTPKGFGEKENLYHARVKNVETVTTEKLAAQIEHDTSLTQGDVMNVLASVAHYLADYLGQGKRLHLKGIGYFSLAVETVATASPKDMRAEYVRARGVNYQAEKKLKKKLAGTNFERTKFKVHSEAISDEEVRELVDEYFADHTYMRRGDFELLCGLTRTTAIRRLNALCDEGFLTREGARQSPVYLRNSD